MCLFSIKEERDEEPRVATRRVVRREDRYSEYQPRRASRVSVRASESVIIPPPAPMPIPLPSGKVLPLPQPVPQFEMPPPAPPEVHYVHVSPRSSVDDDYHYERREVRYERDVSPRRPENYEFRYVDAPEEVRYRPRRERSRSRSRPARSRSRVRHDDYDDYEDDREQRTKVKISRDRY